MLEVNLLYIFLNIFAWAVRVMGPNVPQIRAKRILCYNPLSINFFFFLHFASRGIKSQDGSHTSTLVWVDIRPRLFPSKRNKASGKKASSRVKSSSSDIEFLGPVVQRPISSNPGLNFNPAFFISLFKSLLGKVFTILFRTSNDQIASKKIWTEFSLKVFRPEIKFHTNPGLP